MQSIGLVIFKAKFVFKKMEVGFLFNTYVPETNWPYWFCSWICRDGQDHRNVLDLAGIMSLAFGRISWRSAIIFPAWPMMVGTSHRGILFVTKMTSSTSRVTLDRRGAMFSIVPPGNVLQHALISLSCTRWPRPWTNDDPTIDTLTRRRPCPRVFLAVLSSMGSGDWIPIN